MNQNHSIKLAFAILISGIVFSCNRPSEGSLKAGSHIQTFVAASVETEPTPRSPHDDSADDPAIWVCDKSPEKSFIIGTDKKGGLATYDLSGAELNYYPCGEMNNCDLRYGFVLGTDTIDILAASNRSLHALSLFKISADGRLDSIHSRIIKSSMSDEVYGLCMYKNQVTGKMYVFVNGKSGEVEQFELIANGDKVDAMLVDTFRLGSQTEGMVADDKTGWLYIGEEKNGIWKFNIESGDKTGIKLENSSEQNPNIRYDIEGLAIYSTGNGEGYLVASSQGNYAYAVFERHGSNKYLGSFRIAEGAFDRVEETDGLDVTNLALPGYPKGILVVQDGFNRDSWKAKSQNFKIIDWETIEKQVINPIKNQVLQ